MSENPFPQGSGGEQDLSIHAALPSSRPVPKAKHPGSGSDRHGPYFQRAPWITASTRLLLFVITRVPTSSAALHRPSFLGIRRYLRRPWGPHPIRSQVESGLLCADIQGTYISVHRLSCTEEAAGLNAGPHSKPLVLWCGYL